MIFLIMEIKIYYRDTDSGGIVYYSRYLEYFEIARTEWMQRRGVSVKKLARDGILFIVKNAELEYLSPARYGDVIEVKAEVRRVTGASIEFFYNICEKDSSRPVVKGSTLLVCINNKMKPIRIPGFLKDKFSKKAQL